MAPVASACDWSSFARRSRSTMGRQIDLSQDCIPKREPSLHSEGSDTCRQSEVKHVPAYSHSDGWVGAGGAWVGAWVGAGEIPWSQGIRNLRRGTVFRTDRAVP